MPLSSAKLKKFISENILIIDKSRLFLFMYNERIIFKNKLIHSNFF